MKNGFSMLALEISKIEKASAEELIRIAEKNKKCWCKMNFGGIKNEFKCS